MAQCITCGGRRHVVDSSGQLARCPRCYLHVFDERFVVRALRSTVRGVRSAYPPAYDALTPWSADAATFAAPPTTEEAWKMMVWRSLSEYRFVPGWTYRYVYLADVARAVANEPAPVSAEDLDRVPLLVLRIVGTENTSDFMQHVLASVLTRAADGRGLWVYSSVPPARLRERFGSLVDSLPPVEKIVVPC